MQPDPLNSPRWPDAGPGAFSEAWYVVASDPRAVQGLWLRYTADLTEAGKPAFALWGSWFEEDRTFALRTPVPAAAISRTGVRFGEAELTAGGCSGEVEGGGHSLRWRLAFGQGAPGEEFIPQLLRPLAKLRGSGYLLPHPATTVTGAVEVDGRIVDLQRVSASQAHLWSRRSLPAWAWARCSAFAEDPEASLDLVDVEGPGGVHAPMFVFRFRGEAHRFSELPWIAMISSRPAAPSWHFSAQDARLSIDGVAWASPSQMVAVQYTQTDGSMHHCINTELASIELRVRTRAFIGAPWRPEATLTSKRGASLEFRGREPAVRVSTLLVTGPQQKGAPGTGSVAS